MIKSNPKLEEPRNYHGIDHDSLTFERHFSVKQVAELWGFSQDAIRRLFRSEPGVVAIRNARSIGKRRYQTLRIPKSVMERVHQNISVVK
jgi:hypothetical protein